MDNDVRIIFRPVRVINISGVDEANAQDAQLADYRECLAFPDSLTEAQRRTYYPVIDLDPRFPWIGVARIVGIAAGECALCAWSIPWAVTITVAVALVIAYNCPGPQDTQVK